MGLFTKAVVQLVPETGWQEPGGVQWLFYLERRAILPVKWLMWLLCLVLSLLRTPETLPSLQEFVLLVFYFVTNLGFSYYIYLNRIRPENIRSFSIVSFAIDVFVMASFIFLTGGIHSDFFMLFFLVILRGLGFFPSSRMNLVANVVVGLIYIGTLVLAAFDPRILFTQEFYEKVALVMGVVFLSWFLIEVQSQQRLQLIQFNRRLSFERAYVHNLLESMTDGVVSLDEECRMKTINVAAEKILHLPAIPLSGEERKWIPEPILKACRYLNQTGKETTDETMDVRLHDGRMTTLRLSTRALKNEAGESAGVVAIFEDLSTLRKIEEQLMQSEKLASVGHLAAGVAHELGNPIGIIKSCAEYVLSRIQKDSSAGDKSDRFEEEVSVIASESQRCQRILRELLSYSSQEAVALVDLDVNELVRRAENLVAYQASSKSIHLEVALCVEASWVLADENLLIQALVNILLNAVQAIEQEGSIIVRTQMATASEETVQGVWIEIQDDGPGIPPENLRKIFEPFFTTRDEGTGLGLAITQRILERLGGKIHVESELGKGTLFRLWIQKGTPPSSLPQKDSVST